MAKRPKLDVGNLTVEAIELGLLDKRYELITLGNSYKVDNQFIYAVERLQVIEKNLVF